MNDKPTIVIVEDDDAIATGLALNLRIANYSPEIARDGDEALVLIGEVSPSLILLDINLPNKTGLEVLAELRKGGDHTPVVQLHLRYGMLLFSRRAPMSSTRSRRCVSAPTTI